MTAVEIFSWGAVRSGRTQVYLREVVLLKILIFPRPRGCACVRRAMRARVCVHVYFGLSTWFVVVAC